MWFLDNYGAFWCVGTGRIMCDFLIIVGAVWCVEKGRSMCDFLILLEPCGVLKRVEVCVISLYFWSLLVC